MPNPSSADPCSAYINPSWVRAVSHTEEEGRDVSVTFGKNVTGTRTVATASGKFAVPAAEMLTVMLREGILLDSLSWRHQDGGRANATTTPQA